jgi:hypothetical protein
LIPGLHLLATTLSLPCIDTQTEVEEHKRHGTPQVLDPTTPFIPPSAYSLDPYEDAKAVAAVSDIVPEEATYLEKDELHYVEETPDHQHVYKGCSNIHPQGSLTFESANTPSIDPCKIKIGRRPTAVLRASNIPHRSLFSGHTQLATTVGAPTVT